MSKEKETEVGRRVKEALDKAGTSQQKIAKMAGLSPWTVYGACKGKQSEQTRSALAKALNIDPLSLGPTTLGQKGGAKPVQTPEPVPQFSAPQPAPGSIAGLVEGTITEDENRKLAEALFRTRLTKGFTETEMTIVEAWAEKVKADHLLLQQVFDGNADIELSTSGVRLVPRRTEVKTQTQSITSNKIDQQIEEHLEVGRKAHGWKDYYLAEKRNVLRMWSREAGILSANDIKLPKYEQVLRKAGKEGKTTATVEKWAKHLGAFTTWAAEKGYMAADVLVGMYSIGTVRKLMASGMAK